MNPSLQRGLLIGVAIGAGAVAVGAVFLPAIAQAARPFAKAVTKAGLAAYERGVATAAEIGEATDDLLAEVRSELADETAAAEAAAAEAAAVQAGAATVEPANDEDKPKTGGRDGARRPTARRRA